MDRLNQLFFSRNFKIVTSRTLLVLVFIISFLGLGKVLAQSVVPVKIQVRVNDNYITEKMVSVPNGCSVTDSSGESHTYTGYRVVCALQASGIAFSVSQTGNGLELDSLEGYNAPLESCRMPNCWTYYVDGIFASSGIDTFNLQQNDTVLFTYGSETALTSQVSPQVSNPTFTTAANPTSDQTSPVAPVSSLITPQTTTESVRQDFPQTAPKVVTEQASQTEPENQVTNSNGCSLRFSWAKYSEQRPIVYGSWDGSYYIFVFETGKTRDEAVWQKQVSGLDVVANNLTSGKNYEGELFLHGAFLAGKPYWASFAPSTCHRENSVAQTVETPNSQTTKVHVNSIAVRQDVKNTTSKTPVDYVVLTSNTDQDSLTNALNFLKNEQDSAGAIGNESESAWAALALASAGQTNSNLINFIKSHTSLNTATDVERTIIFSVALGINPRNFNGTDLIAKLESFHRNGQVGIEANLNDDVFAILALCAAGVENSTFNDSFKTVVYNQNPDGGWGFQKVGESDVDTTSAVVEALVAVKKLGLNFPQSTLEKAKTFLLNNQNSDGGFRFNSKFTTSNTPSTAWALQALYSLGVENQGAEKFLLLMQSSDGGFKIEKEGSESILATSYAVISLEKKFLPFKTSVLSTKVLPDTGFEIWLLALTIVVGFLGLNFKFVRKAKTKPSYADFYFSIHRSSG
jgi:hypothetical protein